MQLNEQKLDASFYFCVSLTSKFFVGHNIDFYKERKIEIKNKFGKNKEHILAQTRALSNSAQTLNKILNLTKLIGRAWFWAESFWAPPVKTNCSYGFHNWGPINTMKDFSTSAIKISLQAINYDNLNAINLYMLHKKSVKLKHT